MVPISASRKFAWLALDLERAAHVLGSEQWGDADRGPPDLPPVVPCLAPRADSDGPIRDFGPYGGATNSPIPSYRVHEEGGRPMPAVMTHMETHREATEMSDGTWSGFVACDCAWQRLVTGLANEDSVDLALNGAWVVHEFRG
jgi:hypothetical protein